MKKAEGKIGYLHGITERHHSFPYLRPLLTFGVLPNALTAFVVGPLPNH